MEQKVFSNRDYWKGITLFGLNVATYKMALGKTILEFAAQQREVISWDEVAESFLNQYIRRFESFHRPQISNPSRITVVERVIAELERGRISHTQAVDRVANKGLENVVPRFQTVGRDADRIRDHFYAIDYGRSIQLKDSVLTFGRTDRLELEAELDARWSLLEGAFTISQSQFDLGNDIREVYLAAGYDRMPLTTNIPFLIGYQGNTCFYCGEDLENDTHVDHVLPRQVLQHDEIWNLVLAHGDCNLLKSDKVVGPHFVSKLVARNENIMGSNHPWKQKIVASLGNSPNRRAVTLNRHYENVKAVLGMNYWGGVVNYNPATDPFYKRFITMLNNPRVTYHD